METFRAKKNKSKAFINPNIFNGLLWESFLFNNEPKMQVHQDFFQKTFQIPSRMAANIKRLDSLANPFELDFYFQLRTHFESNSYSISEKLFMVGRSLLLHDKVKVLRNWFNVLDFQLLKEFVKKFESMVTPKTIEYFSQISLKASKNKQKMTIFEETMQSLFILQQKLCSSLNLGGIRQIVESTAFLKVNHLLYKTPLLFQLKVNMLLKMDQTQQAEVFIQYFLVMRKACFGQLKKMIGDSEFEKFLKTNFVRFENSFDFLSEDFKGKLVGLFTKNLEESREN